jgi:LacI family transcriptional regulator
MQVRKQQQRVGMQAVARRVNVATSSVSRVLSGHPDVSPEMRERVLAAVLELGYEPDFFAQSLRRGASMSIAFLVADISNPLLASIALGAEKVLRSVGYSMLLTNSGGDPELDLANIRLFIHRRVDGLILSLSSERKKAIVDLLAESQIPTVVVDRQLPPRAGASAVFSDHRGGMLAAANALLDLGHHRIGLVSAPLDILAGRMRLAALREAVTARGLLAEEAAPYVDGPFTHAHGRAGTLALLDAADGAPTALIAGSNQLLSGCLEALQLRGLKPGQDIALITCDDMALARLYQPPIAAITRDTVALGRTAAELLLRRLRPSLPGDGQPSNVVLPTQFVRRVSCCPPPRPVTASRG